MTPKMWAFALAGLVIFALFQLAIPVDICLVAAGVDTISRWHLLMGVAHPRWFPVAVAGLVLLAIGGFCGHYWAPENVPFWQTAEMWLPILVTSPAWVFAGVVLGRLFVAQTL
jgi:hypothetical protein